MKNVKVKNVLPGASRLAESNDRKKVDFQDSMIE